MGVLIRGVPQYNMLYIGRVPYRFHCASASVYRFVSGWLIRMMIM